MSQTLEQLNLSLIGDVPLNLFSYNTEDALWELKQAGFQSSQLKLITVMNYQRALELGCHVKLTLEQWDLLRRTTLDVIVECFKLPRVECISLQNENLLNLIVGVGAFLGDPELYEEGVVSDATLYVESDIAGMMIPTPVGAFDTFGITQADLNTMSYGGVDHVTLGQVEFNALSELRGTGVGFKPMELSGPVSPIVSEAASPALNEAACRISGTIAGRVLLPYQRRAVTQIFSLLDTYGQVYGIRISTNALSVLQSALWED